MLKVFGMVNVVGNLVGIVVGNGGSSLGARMTAVVFG